jgi:hypothetical protein
MSKAARSAVSCRLIAVAALAAGVSWAAMSPAMAAEPCVTRKTSVGTETHCQYYNTDPDNQAFNELYGLFNSDGLV